MKYLIILILLLTACTPTYLPCATKINDARYCGGVCRDRAIIMQRHFREQGVINRVCCGRVNGNPHCWNEVWENDVWFMYDVGPNADTPGWPIWYYPQYERTQIFYYPVEMIDLILARTMGDAIE